MKSKVEWSISGKDAESLELSNDGILTLSEKGKKRLREDPDIVIIFLVTVRYENKRRRNDL
jgi:hypothetical protein